MGGISPYLIKSKASDLFRQGAVVDPFRDNYKNNFTPVRETAYKSKNHSPYSSPTHTSNFATQTQIANINQVTHNHNINKQTKQSNLATIESQHKYISFTCTETNTSVKHKIQTIESNISKHARTQNNTPHTNTDTHRSKCTTLSQEYSTVPVALPPPNNHRYNTNTLLKYYKPLTTPHNKQIHIYTTQENIETLSSIT